MLVALLYTCCITVLFFFPNQELPKTRFPAADKIVHMLVYFVLAMLWASYVYIKDRHRLTKSAVGVLLLSLLLYGIIIEIFQGLFTISRSADILDVAANLLGAILGILFFRSVKHKLKT